MTTRCYVDGKVTKAYLADKLALGLVCTDVVPNGHATGDVAYFRDGTAEEIEWCREKLRTSAEASK